MHQEMLGKTANEIFENRNRKSARKTGLNELQEEDEVVCQPSFKDLQSWRLRRNMLACNFIAPNEV